MLEVIQNGFDGFYYTWNIKQYVSLTSKTNPDGSESIVKGYVNATMADGTPIEDDKVYKGITVSFILNGGDDFINVIGKVYTPRDVVDIGDQREVLVKEFKKLGTIKRGEWIDPENPRMVVEKK